MREELDNKILIIKDMSSGVVIEEPRFFLRSSYTQQCILEDNILPLVNAGKQVLIGVKSL